jgi:hypothetical protein
VFDRNGPAWRRNGSVAVIAAIVLLSCELALAGPGAKRSSNTIVFEEDRIEGKIRRPQLVLIKAEQRPSFQPMVFQSVGKEMNIVEFVSESVVEDSPYQGPFRFDGTKISNFAP